MATLESISIESFDKTLIHVFHHKCASTKMIIFTHGMSEYADRHDYLVNHLGESYNIVSYDVRGHGSSQYSSGYVRAFSDYEDDLLVLVKHYQEKNYQISLMGHSMGGLITLGCWHRYHERLNIEKIFLSGPALGAGDKLAVILQKILKPKHFRLIGKILRHIPVRGSVDTRLLSHDPLVRTNYKNDKKMLKKLKARMVMELLARGNEVMVEDCPKVEIQFVAGELDQIIDVQKIKQYCNANHLKDSLLIIPQALHEIHFEISPMKDLYFQKLRDFFLN